MNDTLAIPSPASALSLQIEGMTCASCVARVEKALRKVPGVASSDGEPGHRESRDRARRPRPRRAKPDRRRAEGRLRRARGRAGSAGRAGHGGATLARRMAGRAGGRCFRCRWCCRCSACCSAWTWMLDGWLQLALATPVQFWLGARFYRAGWKALRAGAGNMDLLVALGTSAAYGLSVYLLLHACGPRHAAAPVLRGLGRGDHAGAARQVAGDARQAPDHRGDPRAERAAPRARAACAATAWSRTSPVAQVRGRRPGGGAARRARRRRRPRRRGREPCRRVADHRRKPAGRQAGGRRGDRRRHQRRRPARGPHHRGRRRNDARAHRAPGRIGAGEEGADPAPGRPRQQRLRAGRARHRAR